MGALQREEEGNRVSFPYPLEWWLWRKKIQLVLVGRRGREPVELGSEKYRPGRRRFGFTRVENLLAPVSESQQLTLTVICSCFTYIFGQIYLFRLLYLNLNLILFHIFYLN